MPDPFEDKRGAVPIKDIYSFDELARLLHCSPSTIRDRASWEDDPLPLRRMNRTRRGTFVWRDELWEWIQRNAPIVGFSRKGDED